MDTNKGFKIICLECGSENIILREEVDYNWGGCPYVSGHYLECQDCNNTENIISQWE